MRIRTDTANDPAFLHIMTRGVGKHILFEKDDDRARYLDFVHGAMAKRDCSILCWALMDNHSHWVVTGPRTNISRAMQWADSTYAFEFNQRYERSGHLFQGPFKRVELTSDEQLLATVVYVHRNPLAGGLTDGLSYRWSSFDEYLNGGFICDTRPILEMAGSLTVVYVHRNPLAGGLTDGLSYRWSSFDEYLNGGFICDTRPILEMAGSLENFLAMHWRDETDPSCLKLEGSLRQAPLAEVLERARLALFPLEPLQVMGLPRVERAAALQSLAEAGLSCRQIGLVTGVSKSLSAELLREAA